MKQALPLFRLLLRCFFCLACLPGASHAVETIRLTNGEWPPYLSEHFKHFGLASRIVTEAFALEGVKVEYGFFPWTRAYKLAELGDWDGSVVWRSSDERAEKFFISEQVVPDKVVFFHLKSFVFDWKSVEDLKGLQIGATLTYDYGSAFTTAEAAHKIDVKRVASDETNLSKLFGERIQAFPVNVDVGYHMLRLKFTPEQVALFTHHPAPVTEQPLRLILSKKVAGNERLMGLFNRGLKRLRDSGKIEQYTVESRNGLYMPPTKPN